MYYIYIYVLYYIHLNTSKKQHISLALRSSKVKAGISSVPFLRKLSSQDVGVTGILPGEVGDVLQDTGGLSEDCGWGWASKWTFFMGYLHSKRHELDDFFRTVGCYGSLQLSHFDAKLGTSGYGSIVERCASLSPQSLISCAQASNSVVAMGLGMQFARPRFQSRD